MEDKWDDYTFYATRDLAMEAIWKAIIESYGLYDEEDVQDPRSLENTLPHTLKSDDTTMITLKKWTEKPDSVRICVMTNGRFHTHLNAARLTECSSYRWTS